MPFLDYPVDPTSLLLPATHIMLSVISLIFRLVVMVGPIGQIALVAIPTALFCRDIFAGPKAFKQLDGKP
jgi:hypothetical protein